MVLLWVRNICVLIAENVPLTQHSGIATAIIAAGIAITTALGPERRGSHFEAVPVVGKDALPKHMSDASSMEREKASVDHNESLKH